MTLKFVYEMQLDFSKPVTDHHYSVKCFPQDTLRQKIIESSLVIEPDGTEGFATDSFGNKSVYGLIPGEHSFFKMTLKGKAETGLDISEHEDFDRLDFFRAQSAYTVPGNSILQFYRELANAEFAPKTPYERALYFMHALHERFNYVPKSTNIQTTAEEAFQKKCGVCQDYSHILLSILRLDRIPARYVVGIMTGEGESHAWIEGNFKGHWYGLDPTNNMLVDNSYIKISHGRDYQNCIVSRGIFKNTNGFTEQIQKVHVSVEQIHESFSCQ